eukprot:TRINITY_DN11635_c0_g1_i3.p2 TRINITY_DN11635_c0_g1~~TRINITY_DN11635_c0_g1_i3.p2  ORF type:complete len:311 (+),score=70.01 TRINITY_DN11635_c0_g1_i3:1859-2791(+)
MAGLSSKGRSYIIVVFGLADRCMSNFTSVGIQSKLSDHHTFLALGLLDAVRRKQSEINAKRARGAADLEVEQDRLLSLRQRLQKALKTSHKYSAKQLLREMKDTDLFAEQAIVLGHAGQHEKALHLIIYRIGDHAMARQYCVDNTQATSRKGRQQLFLSLLKVYLHPSGDKRPFTAEAIELLNSYQSDLDVVEVLRLLPDHWQLNSIDHFLKQSIQRDVHYSSLTRVKKGLAKSEALQTREHQTMLRRQFSRLDERAACMHCGKMLFTAGVLKPFMRYPNGVITCLECGENPSVCPKTGTHFKVKTKTHR